MRNADRRTPKFVGETQEAVVRLVLQNPEMMDELYRGYDSDDEVVKLRISSCFKSFLARPEYLKSGTKSLRKESCAFSNLRHFGLILNYA